MVTRPSICPNPACFKAKLTAQQTAEIKARERKQTQKKPPSF